MILFYDKKDCFGCTTCKNSCPKEAIKMKEDEEGFLYPVIEKSKCIECGICKKVCPMNNYNKLFNKPLVYAAKNIDDSIRMKSASGGAFSAISDYVLENGGVVYGASYNDKFKVEHKKAINKEERNKFMGAKYVQSNLNNIFKDVKEELEDNKLVLFTGTPCEVAGLNNYLKKDYDNLINCDIVCHGTPSPKIFEEYIKYIENKYNKIRSISFRDKESGWKNQKWKIELEDKKVLLDSADVKIYKRIFNKHYAQRPSCHHCKFASLKRPSDITLGDFWGIEKAIPDFSDEKGVSLLLVNTSKGKEILNLIKDKLDLRESNCESCMQPQLDHPTKAADNRKEFWQDYLKNGFEYVVEKYCRYSKLDKLKIFIKKFL